MSKYGYLRDALARRGLLAAGRYLAPGPLTQNQIAFAHAPGYVDRVFTGRLDRPAQRRLGLELTPALIRRSRLAAGGTYLAAWLALETGLACNAAGGSHHASADTGAGYCVFNDVAIAIANLRAQGIPGPFLVVDADVHQGDGTAAMFSGDTGVFTLSIHAERNFPARKARSHLDVALADGTGDREYLAALVAALDRALTAISPRLVFYNAGVDVHAEDKLGRLAVSDEGLRARERMVLSRLRQRGLPVVCVLGGGYADEPTILADRHAILFEEAERLSGEAGTGAHSSIGISDRSP